ncbi:hypothetical protein [Streptomyces melanogenes]|uniref:Uncharacterized protein n=1 Tax=Streptomyces melanogenes TaxID=67326 RepID=A0ABZ1XM25_9ACTN|nr:hypothetical protein [Streptomyces melanogenes]
MQVPRPHEASSGATLLAISNYAATEARFGYWYESLRYRNAHAAMPTASRLIMMNTAFSAVRTLRCDLRASHVFAFTARDSRRAVNWADSGYVPALAALARGEYVGFTLALRDGETAEWCIRPVQYLQLTPPGWCDLPHCTVTA